MLFFVGKRDDADHRPLPHIMMLQLRHCNIELAAQLVFQAAKHLPLVLQRLRVGNVQLEGEETNRHAWLPGTARRLSFASRPNGLPGSFRGAHLGDAETFEKIADLDVVEVAHADAAFETGAHFAGVIFEALQRTVLRAVDHGAIAHDADLRVALEDAVDHVAAGDRAGALDAERVADFGAAQIGFGDHGLEQAFHGFLQFVGNFVDDGVRADIDVFLLGKVGSFAIRTNAESNDDRAGSGGEEHVVFGDGADAGTDDFQLHLICRKFGQHFTENFDGALHVGLDDDAKFFDVAGLELFVELVERDARAAAAGKGRVALFALAVIDDVAGLGFVGDLEVVAGFRNALQAEDFDGRGRRRIFRGAAAIVEHGADFAEDGAADEKVAGIQSAVLHENRGHRAAAFIDPGFEHRTACRSVGVGFQFAQIGDEKNNFEKFVDALLLLGGNFDEFGVAAPFGGHQAVFGELPFYAFELRFWFVDFVDGHDDRNVGGLGVVDGFFRLGHDAVVGGDDEHDDVGDFSAAGAHTGKSFVTGSVDEDDAAIVDEDFVGADVLGNAAGFAAGNIGLANGVEQAGFAVVDVAHHGDDGRTRLQTFLGFFLGNLEHHLFFERDDADDAAEGLRQGGGGVHVEGLVDTGENAAVEQVFQKILGAHVEFFGEFANGDAFRNGDVARRTRFRRGDDGGNAAASRARTLARRVQLALALHLAFIGDRALALRRLAGVERLTRLRLGRHFVRHRREHAGTAGLTRTGPSASRQGATALFKRTIGRAAGSGGAR